MQRLFPSKDRQRDKFLLATLSLLPLPGAPNWQGPMDAIVARAEQEATTLAAGGADAIIIENTLDAPHSTHRIDIETACALAVVSKQVQNLVDIPVGISVLANDPLTAAAIAYSTKAQFIRARVLSGALVTRDGLLENQSRALQHMLQSLMCTELPILADLPMRQAQVETADVPTMETLLSPLLETTQLAIMGLVVPPSLSALNTIKMLCEDRAYAAARALSIIIESDAAFETLENAISRADGVLLENSLRKSHPLHVAIDEHAQQPQGAGVTVPPTVDILRVEESKRKLKMLSTKNLPSSGLSGLGAGLS